VVVEFVDAVNFINDIFAGNRSQVNIAIISARKIVGISPFSISFSEAVEQFGERARGLEIVRIWV